MPPPGQDYSLNSERFSFFRVISSVSWAIQWRQRKFLFFRSQVVNFTSFSWTKTAKLRNNARR